MQRVSERYFAVLAANESVTYIQAEKDSVNQQLEVVKAKLDQGLANSIDYQDAQARSLQVIAREIELRVRRQNLLDQEPSYLRDTLAHLFS